MHAAAGPRVRPLTPRLVRRPAWAYGDIVFSERVFFSFVELTDPSQHRAYNEWHQLDHRPENLLLPGRA
jgi:hypothetical protein